MELQAGELKVEFQKVGDRFSHKLLVQHGDEWSVVLESIEGTDQERWPASPPFQQIVSEPIGRDGRAVLLGVGMSGTGHWSISVDETGAGVLAFDIACRVSGECGFLGSTWQLGSGWSLLQPEGQHSPSPVMIGSIGSDRVIGLEVMHGEMSLIKTIPEESNGDVTGEISSQITLKPTGQDIYPKPHRWAVQCRTSFRLPKRGDPC